jgi:hypothetical protein
LQVLAQSGLSAGEDLPEGALFKAFQSLAIIPQGPLFQATLTHGPGGVTAANDTGLWSVDSLGELRLLFRTGDQTLVPGKTLKSFTILAAGGGTGGITRSFNDSAQLAWLARFTDGTETLMTTTIP